MRWLMKCSIQVGQENICTREPNALIIIHYYIINGHLYHKESNL